MVKTNYPKRVIYLLLAIFASLFFLFNLYILSLYSSLPRYIILIVVFEMFIFFGVILFLFFMVFSQKRTTANIQRNKKLVLYIGIIGFMSVYMLILIAIVNTGKMIGQSGDIFGNEDPNVGIELIHIPAFIIVLMVFYILIIKSRKKETKII
jgi:Na+-driven multidrug efflux pump